MYEDPLNIVTAVRQAKNGTEPKEDSARIRRADRASS